MKRNTVISLAIGVMCLGVAVALWAMPRKETVSPEPQSRVRVVVESVDQSQMKRAVRFSGATRSRQRAALSFGVPARVMQRPVDVGEHVRAGQPLAELDAREFRNAVAMALGSVTELETRLAQAQNDRSRAQRLVTAKAATGEELEKTTAAEKGLAAALEAANARLREAERLRDETVLRAPYAGTVTGVFIEAGEWTAPGRPVLEISGDGPLEINVEVPEAVMIRLQMGQTVGVSFPLADSLPVTASISAIARAASGPGRLFPVTVDLDPAKRITAGMTAEVLFELVTDSVMTIPITAVVNPGSSRPYVFRYHEGAVQKQVVDLGPLLEQRIVVNGGLRPGEQVVTTGQTKLSDGDAVEVAL